MKEQTFRFGYEFTVREDGSCEVLQLDGTGEQAVSSSETQVGTVAFKVAPSSRQAGGRTVTITFYAKAPGVSPVRVALVDSAAGSSPVSSQEGKGIVRVR